MKKLLITTVLIILMSACSKPAEAPGKIILEFWTLQLASEYSDYINGLINEYEQTHPDIKIKWLDVPFKEGEKRALAAAMSNKVPDVINLNPIFSSTLASKKALVNINDFVTEEQKSVYLPAAWKACSLGEMTFGVPWYLTSSITVYNETELKEAGIEKPPEDFDTLMDIAGLIKEKTGHYAFLPTLAEGDFFLKVLVKNGVEIVTDSDNPKALFDSKNAVTTLKKWVKIYNDDLISPEAIVTNHQEVVGKFQSEALTFILIGPNFLVTIKNNSPELYKKINVAPQIMGSSKKVDFSVMNLVVPVKSQHKKEAVDFALFVTSSKNQLAFAKLVPILPSTLPALENDFFKSKPEASLEERARAISASQLIKGAEALPVIRNQQELVSQLNLYVQKALLKKLSPEEALRQAVKKWNSILSG